MKEEKKRKIVGKMKIKLGRARYYNLYNMSR